MSFKNYVVWCDVCNKWTGNFGQSASGIRKNARKAGWITVGKQDFCKQCSTRVKEDKANQNRCDVTGPDVVIYAPNGPYADHLKDVIVDMVKRGRPEIRAIWAESRNAWYALEGSHRIAAAKKLGLLPIIVDVTGKDVQGVENSGEIVDMTAEEAADWVLSDLNAPKYIFRR